MYRDFKVGVVVPAYNEEGLIGGVIEGMPDFVDMVYIVDDASSDGTRQEAERTVAKMGRKGFVVINHGVNGGVGAAIRTGYLKAVDDGCHVVAVMAGDAQMDPNNLHRILDPIVEGNADYVKGNRLISKRNRVSMPKLRLLGNSILTFLTKVCSGYWDIVDPQNGYTAISESALRTIDVESIYPRYGVPNDILIKLNVYNFRVKDVIMPAVYGSEKSKIRLFTYIPMVSWILIKGFFWRMKEKYVIQAFHPLIFFYLTGILLLPAGILTGIYMAYLRLEGPISPGSILLPIFLIITGMQTLFFGMLFDMEATKR